MKKDEGEVDSDSLFNKNKKIHIHIVQLIIPKIVKHRNVINFKIIH